MVQIQTAGRDCPVAGRTPGAVSWAPHLISEIGIILQEDTSPKCKSGNNGSPCFEMERHGEESEEMEKYLTNRWKSPQTDHVGTYGIFMYRWQVSWENLVKAYTPDIISYADNGLFDVLEDFWAENERQKTSVKRRQDKTTLLHLFPILSWEWNAGTFLVSYWCDLIALPKICTPETQ